MCQTPINKFFHGRVEAFEDGSLGSKRRGTQSPWGGARGIGKKKPFLADVGMRRGVVGGIRFEHLSRLHFLRCMSSVVIEESPFTKKKCSPVDAKEVPDRPAGGKRTLLGNRGGWHCLDRVLGYRVR